MHFSAAFLLSVLVTDIVVLGVGLWREISKIACLIGKTAKSTAKVLVKINQEMGELRTMVLQNKDGRDGLWLKYNLDYQQFTSMYCFSISNFSHASANQLMIYILKV